MPNQITRGRARAGDIAGHVISVPIDLTAASVPSWAYIADRPCRVVGIGEIHTAVGGVNAAVRFRKVLAASSAGPGAAAGANVIELAPAFDLTASANVARTATLDTAAADLAAGDKIGANVTGTLTGLAGAAVIHLRML